jgi:hypothetical protein
MPTLWYENKELNQILILHPLYDVFVRKEKEKKLYKSDKMFVVKSEIEGNLLGR